VVNAYHRLSFLTGNRCFAYVTNLARPSAGWHRWSHQSHR